MAISFNVTEEALASTASTNYEPIPAGSYNATIFEVKLEEVKAGPNQGKPRFNIQFKISDGDYSNRRIFGYVSLYAGGDFWKTQSFFSALGFDMKAGNFVVPEVNELSGLPIGVRIKVGKDQNGADRNEVAGFDKPVAQSASAILQSLGATPIASSTPASDIWA
jgi:hypothetical protein